MIYTKDTRIIILLRVIQYIINSIFVSHITCVNDFDSY